MQAEASIVLGVWWVLFEYSSFDSVPSFLFNLILSLLKLSFPLSFRFSNNLPWGSMGISWVTHVLVVTAVYVKKKKKGVQNFSPKWSHLVHFWG